MKYCVTRDGHDLGSHLIRIINIDHSEKIVAMSVGSNSTAIPMTASAVPCPALPIPTMPPAVKNPKPTTSYVLTAWAD